MFNNYNLIYRLLNSLAVEAREIGYSLQSFTAIDNTLCR